MSDIMISNAWEGNLKNISLTIPKNKLVVVTGLSGSGKSTLAVDVIFTECQRQYLEAMGMQGIKKPDVAFIRNVSPAIMISQSESNKNPRSTVGTLTDVYTDLRMIYEKLGTRRCPYCNEKINSAECKEEVEKKDGEFFVYMYCNLCGKKMDKLTRSHLSFNTREGACPTCQGLGNVMTINEENVINEALSLEEGAVVFWDKGYKEYQITNLYHAFKYYGIYDEAKKAFKDYTKLQREILLYGVESKEIKQAFPDKKMPKKVSEGRFEGVFSALWRRMSEKGGEAKGVIEYFDRKECPDCKGERLNEQSRNLIVAQKRLPELSTLSLEELRIWIEALNQSLEGLKLELVEPYLLDLKTKINRIVNVGLGYLSLERQTITLSGGETQRLKLAATLDSDLTGVIYIMDEPTIGLHPKDTEGMIGILKKLRDLGNTVIVIEHDTEVMNAADIIVDIGPGSGKHGGEIIGIGTLDEIAEQTTSVTGQYLKQKQEIKQKYRQKSGKEIMIQNASLHNLKHVNVSIPTQCLVTVTGVSGSGKSSLVFDVIGNGNIKGMKISGLEEFSQVVMIEQAGITRMKRSNVATYSECYAEIRKIFGNLDASKEKGLSAKHFSFNTVGGRCENCEGLGYVESNMLFFSSIEVTCPVCGGKQFDETVLSVKYKGYSIKEILTLSIEEAAQVFKEHKKLDKILKLLCEAGLSYLELGQSLTTLSGGEGQRLKLAKELIKNTGKKNLYLMDEPTTGLHPVDVEHFLTLLNRIVDAQNTVIIVEHNQQVVAASDWIIDLGPEGGKKGGNIMFTGTPMEMIEQGKTSTADALRQHIDMV